LMSRSWFDASRSADPPGVSDAGGQAIPREPTQSAPATNASPGSATQEDKSSGRAVRNAAPAAVRGSVIDQTGNPVDEAIVSIVGFGDATKTNKVGNFVLPVPATDVVQIRAAKAGYVTRTQTHPVSNHPATIQLTRQSP
jgi:Carboxypeptidase regulatory-like domain